MLEYIIFYFSFMILYYYYSKSPQNKLLGICIFIIIVLFSGLRGLVGSDTQSYLKYYNYAKDINDAQYLLLLFEPLFVFLMHTIHYIHDSNFTFIFIYSLFQGLLFYLIFTKIDNKIFILCYVLLFFIEFHFNTIRAGTAALCLLYSVVTKNDKAKVAFALIAPGFHVSILLFYPIFFLRIRLIYSITTLTIIALLLYSYQDISSLILGKMFSYEDYLTSNSSSFSKIYLMYIAYIAVTLLSIKNLSKEFCITGLIIMALFSLAMIYPIAYRGIVLGWVLYFYFLSRDLTSSNQTGLFKYYLYPLLIVLSFTNIIYIINESDRVSDRISVDLSADVLDSTYIPYKFYWNDDKAQSLGR